MRYFNNCHDLESLKKEYKRLVKKLHPDCGGSHEEFIAMQTEYKERFEYYKRQQNKRAERDDSVKHTDEVPEDYMEIIAALIKIDGIEIDICGTWVWVYGNTKEHKEEIKAAGLHYSGRHKKWHWHPESTGKGRRRSSGWSYDQIKNHHGQYKVA